MQWGGGKVVSDGDGDSPVIIIYYFTTAQIKKGGDQLIAPLFLFEW